MRTDLVAPDSTRVVRERNGAPISGFPGPRLESPLAFGLRGCPCQYHKHSRANDLRSVGGIWTWVSRRSWMRKSLFMLTVWHGPMSIADLQAWLSRVRSVEVRPDAFEIATADEGPEGLRDDQSIRSGADCRSIRALPLPHQPERRVQRVRAGLYASDCDRATCGGFCQPDAGQSQRTAMSDPPTYLTGSRGSKVKRQFSAKPGSYPTTYTVNYDASAKEFRITLWGLTKR